MNLQNSLLFLFLLVSFLWVLKADLIFMIFGTAVLIYIMIQLFFMDPVEIIISTGQFFLINPFGILILFIPLIIHGINYGIKKLKRTKKRFA